MRRFAKLARSNERGKLPAFAVLLLLFLCALTACGSSGGAGDESRGGAAVSTDPCGPWGCEQQARFDAASQIVAGTNRLAVVVTDRQTGRVWRSGDRALRTWAGSTPKLALTVYLLEEQRAGRAHLTKQNLDDIDEILAVSDDDAANRLWDAYGFSEADLGGEVMRRWRNIYGMTGASYVDDALPHWGSVKLGPDDLIALMRYVMDGLNPDDRAFIVDRMRTVGRPQKWGVWGVGPQWMPGVKNGWYYDESGQDRWVLSTVGFVGEDERYLVAAMYDEAPGGVNSIGFGVHLLTDLVATIFGAPVPAPAEVPKDF
jgi:hypothetical protein